MKIGDQVLFEGRVYVLRGIDPMSVPDRMALIEDPATGDLLKAPFQAVSSAQNRPGFDSEGLG